jgi:hypothetical protein
LCAMKRGPIPGINIAHNTATRGYQTGEMGERSAPVSRPLNIAPNTLPQVFAWMGLGPPVNATPRRRGEIIKVKDPSATGTYKIVGLG